MAHPWDVEMWNGVHIIKHHSCTLFSDAQRSGFWALCLRHNLIALITRLSGETLLAGPDLRFSPHLCSNGLREALPPAGFAHLPIRSCSWLELTDLTHFCVPSGSWGRSGTFPRDHRVADSSLKMCLRPELGLVLPSLSRTALGHTTVTFLCTSNSSFGPLRN